MKILSIDSSGLVASVALVGEEKTYGEITTNYNKTHSQTLMPMVAELCRLLDFNLAEADYIACASGPGSFTGLRIGAAAAKGLARGLNKKIVPVPALDALAYNVFESERVIVPIMDARRGQVYTCFYKWNNNRLVKLSEYMAVDIEECMSYAKKYPEAVFLGDGVLVHEKTLRENSFFIAPQNMNMQRGASVGTCALNMTENAVDAKDFLLFYLRPSQAERMLK